MTVGIVLAVGLFTSDATLHGRLLTIFSGERASASRIEMETIAFEVFRTHPIIGVGIDNFEVYTNALKKVSSGTCNLYSRVLVESGILGLTSFLIFMLHIFRAILKGVKGFPPGSRENLIQVAFLGGFLANAIDFLFFGIVFPFPWIFFFFGTASAKFANSYYNHNIAPKTIYSYAFWNAGKNR